MPSNKEVIKVVVDGQTGTVEIYGSTSQRQFKKTAERLGLKRFDALVRAMEVDQEDMDHVMGRARILGYELEVRGREEEYGESKPGPSRGRRSPVGTAIGLVTIPAMILALGAVLTGLGTGIRDRLLHDYAPVASLRTVVSMVNTVPADKPWYENLVNPDDTRYVSLSVQDAVLLGEKEAIVDRHLVQIPRLTAPSIADLVADGGTLSLQMDTRKSEANRIHIDQILKDGNPTGEKNLWMELRPIAGDTAPVDFADGEGIRFDSKETFEHLSRFRTGGYLQRTESGLRVTGRAFHVALTPGLDPALARILERFIRPTSTEFADESEPRSPLLFFLELQEIHPWSTDGTPGLRQTDQEIGVARLVGVRLGDLYLENRPG